MRELKFRFIDKGDGTVYKPITLKELCLRIEIPRRIILESENGDFVDTDDFLDQLENGELICEQYTGLKDKNGKEIYEGDILNDGEGHIGEVLYNERIASFAYEWGVCGSTFMSLYTSDMKIIGNIHEGPELLKEEE